MEMLIEYSLETYIYILSDHWTRSRAVEMYTA